MLFANAWNVTARKNYDVGTKIHDFISIQTNVYTLTTDLGENGGDVVERFNRMTGGATCRLWVQILAQHDTYIFDEGISFDRSPVGCKF